MITGILISAIYIILRLFLSPILLLPSLSVESDSAQAVLTASSYINNINNFFPLNTFLIILFLILSIEAGIMTYKIINWLLKKIPGIS